MARESERDGSTEGAAELSTADAIRQIAASNARASLTNEDQLLLFLKSWWSRTYNRPLKDPLLLSYTLEELLYEFYDRIERKTAEEERIKAEEEKQEDTKEKAVQDWAEKMEREEMEKAKTAQIAKEAAKIQDPTKDPDNIKWMEEQIKLAKKVHGDSFGEDIETNFDEPQS